VEGIDMSGIGNSVQIVWVIRLDRENEASLLAVPIDDRQLGVVLFTQREHAEDFGRSYADMPAGAIVAHLDVSTLSSVLEKQQQLGRTHVVTDPIPGSPTYMDQQTLAIRDYIDRLAV
jgi:hypothetical protein